MRPRRFADDGLVKNWLGGGGIVPLFTLFSVVVLSVSYVLPALRSVIAMVMGG